MIYYDFPSSDSSSIAVQFEQYEKPEEVELHSHRHYEFTLVNRGNCIHRFRGVEVPLIAGDVFLIPPHEEHGYSLDSGSMITNCYFFPERMEQLADYLKTGWYQNPEIPLGLEDVKKHWDGLLLTIDSDHAWQFPQPAAVSDNLTKQGVLHLSPAVAMDVASLLQRIYDEHQDRLYDSEYMKAAILQMILVIFKRANNNQPQRIPQQLEHNKQLIIDSLIYLEENYYKPVTTAEMAAVAAISISYFRSIFKQVTGQAPLEYLNRLRIIKALSYIQSGEVSIAEAAQRVGIPDQNYFSRVFKKMMGYPPKYFMKNTNK